MNEYIFYLVETNVFGCLEIMIFKIVNYLLQAAMSCIDVLCFTLGSYLQDLTRQFSQKWLMIKIATLTYQS